MREKKSKLNIKAILLKTFALLCAAVMILSLAACGDNSKNETAETTAETVAVTEAAAATEAAKADASDKSIVGIWEYEYGGFTYTFNDDGTGTYDIFGDVMNFTYTITDTEVSIRFDGDAAASHLEYTLDGDVLNIKDSAGNDTIYNRK